MKKTIITAAFAAVAVVFAIFAAACRTEELQEDTTPQNEGATCTQSEIESVPERKTNSESEWESFSEETFGEEAGLPSYLTADGICEVAPESNIIIFLIDRFDVKYYERMKTSHSDADGFLDGFTYFSDNLSHYTATYPAISYLVTGIEQNFELTASEYFEKAYNQSDFLRDLRRNDYSIKLYTDSYHAYRDDTPMTGFIRNAVVAKDEERADMYVADDVDLYGYVLNGLTVQSEHKNAFIFYHLNGCHYPVGMDENCRRTEGGSIPDAALGCFKIIEEYINRLKTIGLYENATIVITGDHSAGGTDEDAAPVNGTVLLVKRAGETGHGLYTSDAQVCDKNLIPTLIKSAGIKTEKDYGEGYFDVDGQRERILIRFQYGEAGTNDCTHYKISGPWRDKTNWTVDKKYNIYRLYR